MTVNLWTESGVGAAVPRASASDIPRRTEGYAVLLEFAAAERVAGCSTSGCGDGYTVGLRPRGAPDAEAVARRLLRRDARPGARPVRRR